MRLATHIFFSRVESVQLLATQVSRPPPAQWSLMLLILLRVSLCFETKCTFIGKAAPDAQSQAILRGNEGSRCSISASRVSVSHLPTDPCCSTTFALMFLNHRKMGVLEMSADSSACHPACGIGKPFLEQPSCELRVALCPCLMDSVIKGGWLLSTVEPKQWCHTGPGSETSPREAIIHSYHCSEH